MVAINDHLCNLFTIAIRKAYPLLTNIQTVITAGNNPKFGDYQCNSAMQISNVLKNDGTL